MVALRRKFESGHTAAGDLLRLPESFYSLHTRPCEIKTAAMQADHLGIALTCCFRMRVIVLYSIRGAARDYGLA